jgi:hypothetical protein
MCAAVSAGGCRGREDGHVGAIAGQFFRIRAAKSFAGGRDDG